MYMLYIWVIYNIYIHICMAYKINDCKPCNKNLSRTLTRVS